MNALHRESHMKLGRSALLASALTLTLAASATAGYCHKPPKRTPADISFSGVICQDPRLVGTAVNDGETDGTFILRFVSGKKPFALRKVEVTVPAGSSRSIRRWVKGGTVVFAEFDGERIFSTKVNRRVNVGRCPR